MSTDGDMLLSASPSPPTIFIQDLRFGCHTAVNWQPADVQSPAILAAFRDEVYMSASRYTYLVVGFQDGTLSLFKTAKSSRRGSYLDTNVNPTQVVSPQPVRAASIKKLHKVAMGGMTAAAFLPGYKSRVVSVGHDGRCRLVDFEGGGRILRT